MAYESSFLEKESVIRLIPKLSFPAMAGMIAQALYNVVDAIFVGRGVGMLAVAGISIAFPIQMIIMATAQVIGVGSASIISRSLGEKNRDKAEKTLGNLMGATLVFSAIVATLGLYFLDPVLRIFGATDAILPFAAAYMKILFLGSVFFAFSIACNNAVRAEGKASFAMITMLISAGVNIVLDPIFIFGFGMGIQGAAIATVIAQTSSALWLGWYYIRGKSEVPFLFKNMRPNYKILYEVTAIGLSAFLRQGAASISLVVINRQLAFWGGDAAIAAMGILLRITQFAVMPVFGLVQGLLPIVGYNYGARLFCRVTTAMKLSIAISSAICTLTGSLLFFAPQLLIPLFTNNREVLPLGISASRYMAIGFPLIGFQVMASGLYQAIGKTVPALFLSLLRQVLILIPLVLFLPYFYGLLGIWTAFPISDILAAIITLVLYRKDIKRLSTLCAEKAQLNKGE